MWDITTHPFRAQHPRWHSFIFLRDMRPHQIHLSSGPASLQSHCLVSSPFEEQPRRWYIVQCRHSFISLRDMGPHQIHLPLGPSVLTGTPPRVFPLRRTTSLLAHSPVSDSNIICNGPSTPLAKILSSLRFYFRASPQGFITRLLGKDFQIHKGVSFSSPTNGEISHYIYIISSVLVLGYEWKFFGWAWALIMLRPKSIELDTPLFLAQNFHGS